MSLRDFALPDLGEGLTESELVSWEVQVGDTVELNQILAEVETAKALVQLPSPFAGVVRSLLADPGDSVRVGSVIVSIETDDGDDSPPAADLEAADAVIAAVVDPEPVAAQSVSQSVSESVSEGVAPAANRTAVLVGYGPKGETGELPRRRHRRTEWLASHQAAPVAAPDAADSARSGATDAFEQQSEVRSPITGVRRRMAEAMVQSAFTAPHASLTLTVDVTQSLELLDRLRQSPRLREHSMGILTLVAKACLVAIKHTPEINSRWDESAQEVVQFAHVNLGIAVATDRGLLVPNIRGADELSLPALADAMTALTASARESATTPHQLVDGTFTVTNVGVFGVDAGTPILPPGEAAILALGAIRRVPWEHDGEIALRSVVTLTLAFDHRLIDGRQGSEFLTTVGSILRNPAGVLALV
ncbi:dihydrolipoamide acetyltransferase family protein [Salinibacterium hongtaonis]|uniref:Dihydrolipoamide acetyltransferase component of pyruvate dehydrogenase complex n=1 Tax=Homoserinimonas hongtaonis TaxID=2079791 RepID=A0A2U1SZ96_9MICO|nr:dihydrolipoamide acetyltransferase family protein [Salinibacterium hongtaonis]PWB96954.1 branched-chain alpha-keto acid dehydrogenase subunit E2 [Salinibacterium hongtaonis]